VTNANEIILRPMGVPFDMLTKREYFAAMAMQGLLANTEVMTRGVEGGPYGAAVAAADALLAALAKEDK
jgi:hypothetical protein